MSQHSFDLYGYFSAMDSVEKLSYTTTTACRKAFQLAYVLNERLQADPLTRNLYDKHFSSLSSAVGAVSSHQKITVKLLCIPFVGNASLAADLFEICADTPA